MRDVTRSAVLLLNATYEPLSICHARRALTLVVKGVALIEEHTGHEVHAGILMPSVVRLKDFRRVPHRVQVLTRRNLLTRDRHQCQYCREIFTPLELTLDHVMPRSRGGLSTWENLVAACKACNREKSNRTPEEAHMPLLRRPRPVTLHTSRGILRSYGADESAWRKYLYFDNEGSREHVLMG